VPEREQRRGRLVPVALVGLLRLERAVVVVDHRDLPDRAHPRERQLAAGHDVAEQGGRDGVPAPGAGIPDLEDRRDVLGGPAQVERASRHDRDHGRGAGRDDLLQELELAPGKLEGRGGGLLPDHVLGLADHDQRDLGPCGELDGAGQFGVVVEALRDDGQRVVHVVEHRGEHPLGRTDARRVADAHAFACPGLHPGEDGHRLVRVVVEDPGAEGVAGGVGELADDSDAALTRQRQQAVVLQQDEGLLRGLPGDVAMRRIGQDGGGCFLVDERVLEQSDAELRQQDAADRLVDGRLVHQSGLDGLGEVRVGRVGDAHLHVEPGVERAGAGVGEVGGEVLRRQRPDGVGVADHPAVEAEVVAEDVGEQPPVAGGRDAVEVHVRAHDVAGTGLDGRAERWQVDVVELGVGDVGVLVVASAARRAVASEVLRAGDDAFAIVQSCLEATHLGSGHGSAEDGILACALDDAAPAGVAGDVDHRRERPADADRAGLTGRDGLAGGDGLRAPRGRQRDRRRQDRPQAVDHVEAEDDRDAQPGAGESLALQLVREGRVLDEQQRAGGAGLQRGLDHRRLLGGLTGLLRQCGEGGLVGELTGPEVEVLRELARLLGESEPTEQIVGSFGRAQRGVEVGQVGHRWPLFAGETVRPGSADAGHDRCANVSIAKPERLQQATAIALIRESRTVFVAAGRADPGGGRRVPVVQERARRPTSGGRSLVTPAICRGS